MTKPPPPYRRIVEDIRRRIADGELRPGDRIPSARRIRDEWGVALATATKALTTMRHEGLVFTRPGAPTTVAPQKTIPTVPLKAARQIPSPPTTPASHARQRSTPPTSSATTSSATANTATNNPARGNTARGNTARGNTARGNTARGNTASARIRSQATPVVAVRRGPARPEEELTRDRVVTAAIGIADTHGLDALTMRGVAARLGVATMSPYRHVKSKDELVLLMADAAFAELNYPQAPPAGWRERLELGLRTLWALYQRHPWLSRVSPFTRPLPLPHLLMHAEWALRALRELGLNADTMRKITTLGYGYVRGIAAHLEREALDQEHTGLSYAQWLDSQRPAIDAVTASGRYPTFQWLSDTLGDDADRVDLDDLFEFGLRRLLDGLAVLIEQAPTDRPASGRA